MTIYQQLKARVQLVRDWGPLPKVRVKDSDEVFKLLKDEVFCWDRERLLSIMLNSRNQVIAIEEVSVGSLTASIVHPREVFKSAILANAHSIILVHNHASGDPRPSNEDRNITETINTAGQFLNIHLLDHLIIANDSYTCWSQDWQINY